MPSSYFGRTLVAILLVTATLPAYAQPLLGGARSLRGLRVGARAGDRLAAASAELRLPLSSPLWLGRAAARAAARLGTGVPVFTGAARRRLAAHDWPGNLRELFHLVEGAVILAGPAPVDASLIDQLLGPLRLLRPDAEAARSTARNVSDAGERVGGFGRVSGNDSETDPDQDETDIEQEEKIEDVLAGCEGNLSRTARRLGIPRSTLRYRLGLDDVAARRARAQTRGGPVQS